MTFSPWLPISCSDLSRGGSHVPRRDDLAVLFLVAARARLIDLRDRDREPDLPAPALLLLPPDLGLGRPDDDATAQQPLGRSGDPGRPLRPRRDPARRISREEEGPRRLEPGRLEQLREFGLASERVQRG